MKKQRKDIGASVRARLLRLAQERGEDFHLLLTRYANERFLYRLASSPVGSQFILKGAALFTLWTGRPHRATRDIDLLGFVDPSEAHVRALFTEVLALAVEDDGVMFDAGALHVEPIRDDQEYGGMRVVVVAEISTARVRLQIDVGFGDAVTPAASTVDFPTLLDFPAPRLRAYPRETVVAEKLEAMVQLGLANSRMKDFYDLAVLSKMFDFDGPLLALAIRATFERRNTPLSPMVPVALTPAFADDDVKNVQWAAFVRRSGVSDAGSLPATVAAISAFATLPLAAAMGTTTWAARWPAGGPWSK